MAAFRFYCLDNENHIVLARIGTNFRPIAGSETALRSHLNWSADEGFRHGREM